MQPPFTVDQNEQKNAGESETEFVNRIHMYHCMLLSSDPAFRLSTQLARIIMGNDTGNAAKKDYKNPILCLHLEIIVALGEGSLEKHIRIIKLTAETKATFLSQGDTFLENLKMWRPGMARDQNLGGGYEISAKRLAKTRDSDRRFKKKKPQTQCQNCHCTHSGAHGQECVAHRLYFWSPLHYDRKLQEYFLRVRPGLEINVKPAQERRYHKTTRLPS